jgi:hypothetical protein
MVFMAALMAVDLLPRVDPVASAWRDGHGVVPDVGDVGSGSSRASAHDVECIHVDGRVGGVVHSSASAE